jgi:Putative prokaryotic signal transducing protein
VKKLYRAANLPDAHILRGLLEQAGISVRVFNENAQSGVGQLPFTEAWPEIWVAEERDLARAREIVQAFESAPPVSGSLRCPGCSEDNPNTFQVCWNCGVALG